MKSGENLLAVVGGKAWLKTPNSNWTQNDISSISSGSILGLYFVDSCIVARSTSGSRLYVSCDNGVSFVPLYLVDDEYGELGSDAYIDNNIIYQYDGFNRLFRSNNLGETWELICTLPLQQGYVGMEGREFYIVLDSIIFLYDSPIFDAISHQLVSLDLGKTWTYSAYQDHVIPWSYWYSQGYNNIKKYNNVIFITTLEGVYYSQDNGHTWADWNEGLPSRYCKDLEIYDGFVYMGLAGNGIWKRPLSELDLSSGVKAATIEHQDLRYFYDRYSNILSIEIPQPGNLLIVDVAGRCYLNQSVSSSPLVFSFDTLPAGTYFISLVTNNKIFYNKLVKN
jgi:hypothetical protein